MSNEFKKYFENTDELKQLILDNPELPLLVFASEDANRGEWGYEQASINNVRISELTVHGDLWLDRDDLEEKLRDELCDDYPELSDEDFDSMIKDRVNNTEFVKCIVLYVG